MGTYIFPWRDIGQKRMLLVFRRQNQWDSNIRPFYSKSRVVESHSTVGRGAIEIVALVTEQRVVLEDDEAMREPARNVELLSVLACQRHGDVLSKGWRTFPDVDSHIPGRT